MTSYAPGQVVNTSGIYRVVEGCAACPLEVALMRGERFPQCPACEGRRYRLRLEALPIEEDPDFRS